MPEVTGLDFCVVGTLLEQKPVPSKLRDIVIAIETFSMDKVNLVCAGGTHRSVAMASVLMLTAYPQAVFFPHTERVRVAALRRLAQV